MNALVSEKSTLEAIKRCVKNVFVLNYCMGLRVEMMVTLTQVFMSENFVRQGKTPLFFRACAKRKY